ncbi:hypothetical protein HYH03_010871 [Edaphochlamys debaryana]|uniref:Pherophorin domain-containing protein n=1 Tax=Edaphochlamys debaryana TaxID=47281 RepID=A0A835XVR4_9CHLO|nr:hypothetical protein HYH03_010871 [Edaphochlamys debaryana]|eukprot:KAG2490710.1 hypothetical protein HYH03_010871 [Edaphochlamys debaryana]
MGRADVVVGVALVLLALSAAPPALGFPWALCNYPDDSVSSFKVNVVPTVNATYDGGFQKLCWRIFWNSTQCDSWDAALYGGVKKPRCCDTTGLFKEVKAFDMDMNPLCYGNGNGTKLRGTWFLDNNEYGPIELYNFSRVNTKTGKYQERFSLKGNKLYINATALKSRSAELCLRITDGPCRNLKQLMPAGAAQPQIALWDPNHICCAHDTRNPHCENLCFDFRADTNANFTLTNKTCNDGLLSNFQTKTLPYIADRLTNAIDMSPADKARYKSVLDSFTKLVAGWTGSCNVGPTWTEVRADYTSDGLLAGNVTTLRRNTTAKLCGRVSDQFMGEGITFLLGKFLNASETDQVSMINQILTLVGYKDTYDPSRASKRFCPNTAFTSQSDDQWPACSASAASSVCSQDDQCTKPEMCVDFYTFPSRQLFVPPSGWFGRANPANNLTEACEFALNVTLNGLKDKDTGKTTLAAVDDTLTDLFKAAGYVNGETTQNGTALLILPANSQRVKCASNVALPASLARGNVTSGDRVRWCTKVNQYDFDNRPTPLQITANATQRGDLANQTRAMFGYLNTCPDAGTNFAVQETNDWSPDQPDPRCPPAEGSANCPELWPFYICRRDAHVSPYGVSTELKMIPGKTTTSYCLPVIKETPINPQSKCGSDSALIKIAFGINYDSRAAIKGLYILYGNGTREDRSTAWSQPSENTLKLTPLAWTAASSVCIELRSPAKLADIVSDGGMPGSAQKTLRVALFNPDKDCCPTYRMDPEQASVVPSPPPPARASAGRRSMRQGDEA